MLGTVIILPDVLQQQAKVEVGICMPGICGVGSHMAGACGQQWWLHW